MRYRNTGDQLVWARKAGVHVDPGEVFDPPVPLNNSAFEEMKEKKKDAGAAGKEDQ